MGEARETELALLHPAVARQVAGLIAEIEREQLPLRVFETVRTPWRQRAQLRKKPPSTRADAWQSPHQYGLAVDMVFHVGGEWTWEEPEGGMWHRYGELARSCGLEQLSFEQPHVQLASWKDIGDICPWTAGQMSAWQRAGLEFPE